MGEQLEEPDLKSILQSTAVGELALSTRPTLGPSDSIAAAAEEMRDASHGSAVICESGKLVGIFTERDLLRAIGEERSMDTPLSDVMTANPKTVRTTDTLFDAIRWMDQGGYRRLPVTDPQGAPVGFFDVKTVTHFLVEHFPEGVYNQAAHNQLIAKNREGA